MTTKKRLGRPPDTTSDETRQRILAGARDCFGRFGYAKTTNKDIAAAAGITTGAIYHYFDSKPKLFAAVADEVTHVVFGEFARAIADESTFVDRLRAILDTASKLHAEDPSFARFSATFPIELQRHPELTATLRTADNASATAFYHELARQAAESGELPADLPVADVANMIMAITMGLAYFGAIVPNTDVHRGSVVATQRVLAIAFRSERPARKRRGRRAT